MIMNRLLGKVAVVTGGAMGIGLSACRLMAREGARIALTDMLDKEGEQAVRTLQSEGGDAAFWHLDVSREAEVAAVFPEVQQHFGRIDILVNNAGISGVNKPTHEITEQEWDRLMAVNVKGVFFCTKHVIAAMRAAGGGSIINLSSIYGLVGAGDVPPYHASKGAVRLMSKNDALIYAADRIRVNSIHPGFIETPMVDRFVHEVPAEEQAVRQQIAALHPLGHIGEPDDIGWAIVYLASDEAKFITGTELVIDGGYTAR
jgi:NAD(P)-dependent dehydrogenase (short-subunit alcohol dehydrogenase family)